MPQIAQVSVKELNISMDTTIDIGIGKVNTVNNIIVEISTVNGIVGYGEGSPYPPLTGETQRSSIDIIQESKSLIEGKNIRDYREIINDVRSVFPGNNTALFALETAIIDCYCKWANIPISELFGGSTEPVKTDITIPVNNPNSISEFVSIASLKGYDKVKMKASGEIKEDIIRVREINNEMPKANLIVDANQAYSPKKSIEFIERLEKMDINLEAFEQPVSKNNIRGLSYISNNVKTPIVADESVFTPVDAMKMIEEDAVDIVNVKLGKSGILETIDIISILRSSNMGIMMGCMLESLIGIHTSGHIVAGTDAFDLVDLDGSLRLLAEMKDYLKSPEIHIRSPGHGISVDDIIDNDGILPAEISSV